MLDTELVEVLVTEWYAELAEVPAEVLVTEWYAELAEVPAEVLVT